MTCLVRCLTEQLKEHCTAQRLGLCAWIPGTLLKNSKMEIISIFFCSPSILGEAGFTNNCPLYSSSTAAPCRAPGVVQPRLQGELCSGAISTAIAWHHSSVTATASHGCIPSSCSCRAGETYWGIAPVRVCSSHYCVLQLQVMIISWL